MSQSEVEFHLCGTSDDHSSFVLVTIGNRYVGCQLTVVDDTGDWNEYVAHNSSGMVARFTAKDVTAMSGSIMCEPETFTITIK